MVMSGGAVATACEEIGRAREAHRRASCWKSPPTRSRTEGRRSCASPAPIGTMPIAEVAHVWYRQPQLLPADVDPGGLEVTAGYKAAQDTGTFSYACHAVAVAVDTETRPRRDPRLRDLRGRRHADQSDDRRRPDLRRPRAGHRHRAVRGDALRRATAQPLASTLADYLLPGADRGADRRASTTWRRRRRYTFFGQKGMGEGGAIAPPAAIANAVNDALAPLGVETAARADHAAAHPRRARARHASGEMKPAKFDYEKPRDARRGGRAARARRRRRQGRRRRPVARPDAQPASRAAGAAGRRARPRPSCAEVRDERDAVFIGAVHHARRDRGRPRARSDRRLSAQGRARHRLPRGAQSRHGRRQPRACRSGRRLGERDDARSTRASCSPAPTASAPCPRRSSCSAS